MMKNYSHCVISTLLILGALNGVSQAAELRLRNIPRPAAAVPDRLFDSKSGRDHFSLLKANGQRTPAPMAPTVTCGAAGVPIQSPPLTAGVTVTGDTTLGTSALNGYTPAGIVPYDERGGELVYEFTTATPGDLRVYVAPVPGVDVDLIILSACDTAQTLAFGDYAAVVPGAPAGTYFIVVDTPNYGTIPAPVFFPGVFSLTAVNSAGLLLVDDDGSGDAAQCGGTCPDVRASYTAPLTAAGFTHTVWDVATQGSPTLPTLGLYKTVIWFTGFSYEPGFTLTGGPAGDQARLRLFQNLGGRVLLAGEDILFDLLGGVSGRVPDGNVLSDQFQISAVAHDIDTIPGGSACPTPTLFTGTASIAGTLRDQGAVGLTAQRVCFDGGTNGARGSVTSIAGGTYSIANLPAGTYTYWVPSGSGAAPTTRSSVLTTGATTGRDFTIQASPWPPGRTLSGVPGNPVSSALVPFASGNQLTSGQPVASSTNSATQNSDFRDFSLVVPAGSSNVIVATSGATGDVDLYVRLNAVPTLTTFDCAPGLVSGNETCGPGAPMLPPPAGGGVYYIRVYGFALGLINFTITGSYTYTGAVQTLNLGGTPFTPYTDALTSRYGQPIFYTADHRAAGFMFDGSYFAYSPLPYSKSIFLAFAPELDATAGRMQTLLTRALGWLNDDNDYCPSGSTVGAFNFAEGEGFTDGAIVNGIPDATETVIYRMTVTNNDSVAHTLKVGLAAQQTFVSSTPVTLQSLGSVAPGASAFVNFNLTLGTPTPPDLRIGESLGRAYNIVVDGNYCHSVGFGSFTGQPQVMIVKDEAILPNTTGIDSYTNALKNIGKTWAVWDTALFSHPTYSTLPPGYLVNERMSPYTGGVIWFTGYDFLGTLLPDGATTVNPETELAALLNAQAGRLFLSSQDYLYDKYNGVSLDIPSADFGYTQLKIQHVNQDIVKDTLENVATQPGVWATEAALNTLTTNVINNFADGTLLRTGVTGASLLATWQSTGFPTGSVRKCVAGTDCGATSSNGLKMVFMPYAFENLADGGGASNKQRMLEKILCQFQTTSGTPPCGYSPPAPLTGTVTIFGRKPGGVAELYWSDPGRLACNGDTIIGPWRVFGATTPSGAQAFLRNSTNTDPATTPASEIPPAGTGEFYTVPSFMDAFGTLPVAVCP